jgi:hypothetical protein
LAKADYLNAYVSYGLKKMSSKYRIVAGILFALSGCVGAQAQTAQSLEYMEASSPLKSGGVVSSRSVPGRPIETSFSNSVLAKPATNGSATEPSSPSVPSTNGFRSPIAPSQTTNSPSTVYPYPATYGPVNSNTIAQQHAVQFSTMPQPQYLAQANSVWIPGSMAPPTTWQVPTLGINNNTVLRPNVSALSVPTQGVDPNAASNPPALNIEIPGSTTTGPSIQYPQAYGPYATSTTQPNLLFDPATLNSSNTRIQPLVKLQNLPPGTYLGQGVIGQPKAYVDGQPVRNLLRYITP